MSVIISIIDPGGGGDFTTFGAWEADTDNDLVAAGNIEIGRLAEGVTLDVDTTFRFNGATTNASNYRQFDVEGPNWDPITSTGTTVEDTTAGRLIRCNDAEDFVRLLGFRYHRNTTSVASGVCIVGTGAGQQCIGVTCERVTASAANGSAHGGFNWRGRAGSPDTFIANCIVFGNGATTGFNEFGDFQTSTDVFNCIGYNLGTRGIFFNAAGRVVKNCMFFDNTGNDFTINNGSMDFSMSSDATAAGADSHTSEVIADNFVDADSQDFRHIVGSNAVDGGEAQLRFDTDLLGVGRPQDSDWDMGVYEFTTAAPVTGITYEMLQPDLVMPVNAEHPSSRDLVAWWLVMPGNDGGSRWYDITKRGHNGTMINMGPATDWVGTGRKGGWGSLEFDRLDDRIEVPAPAAAGSIDMQGWEGITVTAWVRYSGAGTDEHTIFSNWTSAGTPARVRFQIEPATDTLEISIECTGGTVTANITDLVLPVDEWVHVALTYNTTDGLEAVVNGELSTVSTAANGTLATTISEILYIGNTPDVTTDDFGGRIDDIRCYDQGLRPAAINAIYHDSLTGYRDTLNFIEFPFFVPGTEPTVGETYLPAYKIRRTLNPILVR